MDRKEQRRRAQQDGQERKAGDRHMDGRDVDERAAEVGEDQAAEVHRADGLGRLDFGGGAANRPGDADHNRQRYSGSVACLASSSARLISSPARSGSSLEQTPRIRALSQSLQT
jgi:hypothetical protein